MQARTPETLTEVQEHTITWHYCDAADEFADVQAVALQSHLVKVSGNAPVEAKPPHQNDLGLPSAPRPHLGCTSAVPRPPLGCTSAVPRLYLGCTSAAPRLYLG